MEEKEKPKSENPDPVVQQSEIPRPRERQRGGAMSKPKGIDLIGEDLLQIILSTLPALTFASAALVSRSWNLVCNRILSRPKLSSALSLNISLQIAVKEVLDKVLSEPIRPHFAIAYVSPNFCLQTTHKLITEKLGATTPVITSGSNGIIGREVIANEFKEVQWEITDDEEIQVDNSFTLVTTGIVLTVGFLPGLKVDVVPLLCPVGEHHVAIVDEFVKEIRLHSEEISGCRSPAGIIMFGGHGTDMRPVLDKMDYAMAMETFIVGSENCHFLYRSRSGFRNPRTPGHTFAAVALLFARDRNKPHGIGETEFHVTLSTGLSPTGPSHKAVSVRERRDGGSTWLTARREGRHEILDGQTILNNISDELGDYDEDHALYIGVIKRRKFAIELENARWITSKTFHEVLGGDQEYLYVDGVGIKTGDSFHFYCSDSNSALSFCSKVSENFRRLKQDSDPKNSHSNGDRKEVFGGFMFTCCGRGESFFERPNVDSSPFLENFPGIPLAGAFCGGEIRRGSLSSYYGQEPQESAVRCCVHVFSTVYLVMSYTPVLV